jgi:hypothetical protein
MTNKNQRYFIVNKDTSCDNESACREEGVLLPDLAAVESNIRDSFDEIETLRGTVQYWEGRPSAADPNEQKLVIEAYRIMQGELLGLTARMKELRDRAETPALLTIREVI